MSQKRIRATLEATCPQCGAAVILPLTREQIMKLLRKKEMITNWVEGEER